MYFYSGFLIKQFHCDRKSGGVCLHLRRKDKICFYKENVNLLQLKMKIFFQWNIFFKNFLL